jgi:hypothetical protein
MTSLPMQPFKMAAKQMPHGTHGFDRRPLQISRPAKVIYSRLEIDRLGSLDDCFKMLSQVDDVISRHQALPFPKQLDASRFAPCYLLSKMLLDS